MLARGVLCRLAADVPKTSTHDVAQLARLLQRSLSTRNGPAIRSLYALSRGHRAALALSRRSYASTVQAKKPTATVKKAVKKQAAKKPAPAKKAGATAAKPKKKAAAKKAAPAKKPAAKPKRAKKVLSPEEKEKAAVRQLRVTALKEPVTFYTLTTRAVFATEVLKGSKDVKASMNELKEKWRSLSTAEMEHYNHVANETNAARKAEYHAWVRSYTPDQIRLANNARSHLRRLLKGKRKGAPAHTAKIQDDRQHKKAVTPYIHFAKDRWASGDLKSIPAIEASKLISNEWKSLSASEKQKYIDAYEAEKTSKAAEYERTYGHKP